MEVGDSAEERISDPARWRLLFMGEVGQISMVKRPGARYVNLECTDFSSYWFSTKLYWGSKKTSDSTYKRLMFLGATHLHRGKELVDSSNDLVKLLSGKPSTLPGVSGLLGGMRVASGGVRQEQTGRCLHPIVAKNRQDCVQERGFAVSAGPVQEEKDLCGGVTGDAIPE